MIHDENADRRNLTLSSLAFIVFYWGDARLKDNSLALPFINIEFENTFFLIVVAWVSLFWFAIRYWQRNRNVLLRAKQNAASGLKSSPLVKYLILKTQERSLLENQRIAIRGSQHTLNGIEFNYSIDNLKESVVTSSHTGKIRCGDHGLLGKLVTLSIYSKSIIINSDFGDYIAPYILFLIAILAAFTSYASLLIDMLFHAL